MADFDDTDVLGQAASIARDARLDGLRSLRDRARDADAALRSEDDLRASIAESLSDAERARRRAERLRLTNIIDELRASLVGNEAALRRLDTLRIVGEARRLGHPDALSNIEALTAETLAMLRRLVDGEAA